MKSKELRMYDTLVEAQNALIERGFTEQFDTREGEIHALSGERKYEPQDLKIVGDVRFEGMSNPADNMILYAIVANDGTKGTMVDNVGGPESAQDADLIRAIPMETEE